MIENLTKENIDILKNSFIKIDDIKKEFINNPYTRYLIYIDKKEVVGYLYYSDIYDRTEINMIFVRADLRNNGIGTKLLNEFLINTNKQSTLEVRIDNFVAIKLYEKFGFKKVAIRKNYYHDVDGILMEKL